MSETTLASPFIGFRSFPGMGMMAVGFILLVGMYCAEHPLVRSACRVVLIAWLLSVGGYAVYSDRLFLLLGPALLLVSWWIVSDIVKSA